MAHVFHEGFDDLVTASLDILFPLGGGGGIQTTNPRHTGSSHFVYTGIPVDHIFGPFTARDEWYVGFAWRPSGNSDRRVMGAYEGSTEHVRLTQTGSTLQVLRGATAIAGLPAGTTVLIANQWYYVELYMKVHDTNGAIRLRINEEDEIPLTAGLDTRNGGVAGTPDRFGFGPNGGSSVGGDYGAIDDLVFNDATGGAPDNGFWGDGHVEGSLPNGNGTYSQLLGSDGNSVNNFELVDDAAGWDGNATTVASDTPGDRDSYGMEDISAADGVIRAVSMQAIARKTEASARTVRSFILEGGTKTDGAASGMTISDYLGTTRQYATLNPRTGLAWTIAQVNAIEGGAEVG